MQSKRLRPKRLHFRLAAFLLGGVFCLISAAPARAQFEPRGDDFQVNTYTTSYQSYADVAPDGAGGFVIVWGSEGSVEGDSSEFSVQGQRFTSAGVPTGNQFQINTYTTGSQVGPVVGPDGAGGFVVAWRSSNAAETGPNRFTIQGQRFSSTGNPVGGQFLVNAYTTGSQVGPAIGPDGAGGFVVAWQSRGSVGNDNSEYSIQAQRFSPSGARRGQQFQVNTYTSNPQRSIDISPDGAGGFVLVWESEGSSGTDSDRAILGQRYASDGAASGGEFQINTVTISFQTSPSVSLDGAGGFVVVWSSLSDTRSFEVDTESFDFEADTDQTSIQGQKFTSAGSPNGGQFQINTYTSDNQYNPSVNPDGTGGFVVVWNSRGSSGSDASGLSIQGQRYNSAGSPNGGEFQVNSYVTSTQFYPSVNSDGGGGFVVAWQSFDSAGTDNEGSNTSIQTRGFLDPANARTPTPTVPPPPVDSSRPSGSLALLLVLLALGGLALGRRSPVSRASV